MSERFSRTFHARWGDMDFNAHMANTAILDVAPDVRIGFFEENGFLATDFERHDLGPAILEDRIQYFKEIRLLESFEVTLELEGLSEDRRRFRLRNEFLLEDGNLAARITSTGCWFDLKQRRMTVPPDSLWEAMLAMPRALEYEAI